MMSAGVLTYTLDKKFEEMTKRALYSYATADEVVVVENGGIGDYDANIVVKYSDNRGFTAGVNTILRVANGDFIMYAANDTFREYGDIKKLCVSGKVMSPKVSTQPNIQGLCGSCFCIPRNILNKVGLLDERLKVYYSDTEYIDRLKHYGVPMETCEDVVIYHEIAKTVDATNQNNAGVSEPDKIMYQSIKADYENSLKRRNKSTRVY